MSSTIEFKREVYEVGENRHNDDIYMAVSQVGDTNMLNKDDNTIAKDWNLIMIGEKWQIISRVARISSDTAGGMLRYQNGGTKPENYIKNWRKELNNPKPIEQFFNKFYRRKGKVEFEKGSKFGKRDREKINDKLIKNDSFEESEEEKFNEVWRVFTLKFETKEDIKEWNNLYFNSNDVGKHMKLGA